MARRYTYQDVLEMFESEGYVVLSTEKEIVNEKGFVLATTKIKVKCSNGHTPYDSTIDKFKGSKNKKGSRCPRCSKYKGHSYEYVKNEFEKNGYKLLSNEYKNAYTELNYECDRHHKHKITYGNFQQGQRCPYCMAEDRRHDYKYIKEYVESFGYELLSIEYQNNKKPIILQCPFKHKPYEVSFSSFKNTGSRCPYCNESKGEKEITNYLKHDDISFTPQYKFEDLLGIGGKMLSYDFYLPEYNLLIEYQGNYHDGTARNQTKKQFKTQQEHDRRKREYAEKNGYKLLEIWYWEFNNIEEILKLELK